VDDLALAEQAVLNTLTRKEAWKLLPAPGVSFAYVEGREVVKATMSSSSTFNAWWRELLRHGLIIKRIDEKDRYTRVRLSSENEKKSG
jgi:hypothetical protein